MRNNNSVLNSGSSCSLGAQFLHYLSGRTSHRSLQSQNCQSLPSSSLPDTCVTSQDYCQFDIPSSSASGHWVSTQPPLHARPTHWSGDYRETSSPYSPIPHKLETKTEIEVSEVSSAAICTLSILKTGLRMARCSTHKQRLYSLFNHIHSFDHRSSRKNCTPNSEFRVEAILAPLLQILILTLWEVWDLPQASLTSTQSNTWSRHPALPQHSQQTEQKRGTGNTSTERGRDTRWLEVKALTEVTQKQGPGMHHTGTALSCFFRWETKTISFGTPYPHFRTNGKGHVKWLPATHKENEAGAVSPSRTQVHYMPLFNMPSAKTDA